MSFRLTAIYSTHQSVVSINAETDAWDKDSNVVVLDETKIANEVARLESEWTAKEYARKREAEYPTYATQLDEIFHNGIEAWKKVIQVTKDKYPKT